jgi:hypothetical protein
MVRFGRHYSVHCFGRVDSSQPLHQVFPMLVRLMLPFSLSAAMLCCAALWGQSADPRIAPVDVSVQANIVGIPPQSLHATSKETSVTSTWGPRPLPVATTQGQGSSTYGSGKQPNLPARPGIADRVPNASATGNAPKVARDSASGSISPISMGQTQVRARARPIIALQTNPASLSGEAGAAKKLDRREPRSARQRAGLSKPAGTHRQSTRSEPCRTHVVRAQAPCSATSSKAPLSAADRLRQSASATNRR